jgi:hypothetical protein
LPANTNANPGVVATDGGQVTLLDLSALRTRAEALVQEADKATQDAKSMRVLADDLWAQVGKTLMSQRVDWSDSPQLAKMTQQAISLSEKVAADDSQLESIRSSEHSGIGGLASKLGGWNESRKISGDRERLQSQLRPLWTLIGRLSSQISLPDIDPIRGQAVAAEAQAQELEEQAVSVSTAANSTNEELKRRTDSKNEMGFDAPYTSAYFQTYGPQKVESPLILKRGEAACFAAPASLARNQTRRQWVGGSQGFSFPIGHTGIRYRVGSFHGHPIELQSLTKLDSGTLVITNQRIAFIGRTKSTSVPFAKLLHVECYSDAVAVFVEGRENPDFYLTALPKYALFMINWFLNQPDR